jgi:MFS family permease
VANCWSLSITFLRDYHLLSRSLTSLIYSGFAIAVFCGALSGGKIVSRIGRKTSTVSITLVYGVVAVLFVLVPNAYVAAGLWLVACLLMGLRQPAASSLTVEQVPAIRGSVMSFSTASESIGGMLGAMIASFFLLNYGWVSTGVILGSAAIIAALVLQKFAKDTSTDLLK